MTKRSEQIDAFLSASGWGNAQRGPLAGDASFRRYERVVDGRRNAVLMDAPPPHEDIRPFISIAELLTTHALSAPRIGAKDIENGFLLLEDMGDDLYSRWLATHPAEEEALYLVAAEVLAELYHLAPASDYSHVPLYDEALLMREVMLLAEWFLPAMLGKERAEALGKEFHALWSSLLKKLHYPRSVLVLRDYHADNLLWLPQRQGLARAGLLDFQDAVIGAPAYDMVSFLEDARRDVSEKTVQSVLQHYLRATDQPEDAFMASYALLGAQRNCKIIGIFLRLAMRDGKKGYLAYLPRVWKHLERDVQHPLLADLKQWLDQHIPAVMRGVPSFDSLNLKASA